MLKLGWIAVIFAVFLSGAAACVPTLAQTSTPTQEGGFYYSVTVKVKDRDEPIKDATVTILVDGLAPLTRKTDSSGFVMIWVPVSHVGKAADLSVEKTGFASENYYRNLYTGVLPQQVELMPTTLPPTSTPTATSSVSSDTPNPLPTFTPTETPTLEPPGGIIKWIGCTEIDYESCQCSWLFAKTVPDSKPVEADTWKLENTGTEILEIYSTEMSCENCLAAVITPTTIAPGSQTSFGLYYYRDRDPGCCQNHEYLVTINSSATNCPALKIRVPIEYGAGYIPPTRSPASWIVYDDFASGVGDEKRWGWPRDSSYWSISPGTIHFADVQTDTVSWLPLEMLIPYLPNLDCTDLTGVKMRVRVKQATSRSYVQMHAGWAESEGNSTDFALRLIGGVGLGEVQAEIYYDNTKDSIGGGIIGGVSGLNTDHFYELSIIWDGENAHCFVDDMEIATDRMIGAHHAYPGFFKIEFELNPPGRLDAELTQVWIQCK